MKKSIFWGFIFLVLISVENWAQQIATYGVEGWATYTPGGRGGRIIRVTNLNASGTGTFEEAIVATNPRIIVFEVGGVIDLGGKSLNIKNPYVTIAGQTAPGKGITLINGGLNIKTHDVILQHIRIRTGASGHLAGSWEPDALSTINTYNVIIDHCSFSWAVDENCSASGDRFKGETPDDWRKNTSHDITISNNIIAEGLSKATHSKGEHSKGSLIHDNVTNIAILNNLYASNKDRNPLFKGGVRGVIVNNYIHNPGSVAMSFVLEEKEWAGYEYQTGQMSIVGNYMTYGPSTGNSVVMLKLGDGPCDVFMSDNVSNKPSGIFYDEFFGDTSKIVSEKPIWIDNIKVAPSSDVQQKIVESVGARPWDRDSTDSRIINEMLSGTGKIINSEAEVGGYPHYAQSVGLFKEDEWNLDYMMKFTPNLIISTPVSREQFNTDSIIVVKAEVNDENESFNNLELLVNGISVGKVSQPPYEWNITCNVPGKYELLVVAHRDRAMKMVSRTLPISFTDSIITHIERSNAGVHYFRVSPNPMKERITIGFTLTHSQFVKLEIYNNKGVLVHTLLSGNALQGEHIQVWRPNQLPHGIYFCHLIAGDTQLCRKIIYY